MSNIKLVFITLIMLLCFLGVSFGEDCSRITLVNNTEHTVVGLVNGYLDGERTSYMGAELEPREVFNGTYCYPLGFYDVIWIIPGEKNRMNLFTIQSNSGDITLFANDEV